MTKQVSLYKYSVVLLFLRFPTSLGGRGDSRWNIGNDRLKKHPTLSYLSVSQCLCGILLDSRHRSAVVAIAGGISGMTNGGYYV